MTLDKVVHLTNLENVSCPACFTKLSELDVRVEYQVDPPTGRTEYWAFANCPECHYDLLRVYYPFDTEGLPGISITSNYTKESLTELIYKYGLRSKILRSARGRTSVHVHGNINSDGVLKLSTKYSPETQRKFNITIFSDGQLSIIPDTIGVDGFWGIVVKVAAESRFKHEKQSPTTFAKNVVDYINSLSLKVI